MMSNLIRVKELLTLSDNFSIVGLEQFYEETVYPKVERWSVWLR